jgi:hypothetical protein
MQSFVRPFLIFLVVSSLGLTACGGGGGGSDDDGGGGSVAPPPTDPGDPSTPLPPPAKTQTDNYAIYYGQLDESARRNLETYSMVIVHPTVAYGLARAEDGQGPTRDDIIDLQDGIDNISGNSDDLTVYCYIDAGEDERTIGLTDEQLRGDARFVGDATGPRVDPRPGAPFPDGKNRLGTIDLKGKPSPGGTGYASWYLDDNDYVNGNPDGAPDRVGDSETGIAYANFGDPNWFAAIDSFTLQRDKIAGFNELLGTNKRQLPNGNPDSGFGCDGVFLDVLDPAAPNGFTDETSTVGGGQTEFEWIAPGVRDFIQRIKDAHNGAKVMINRGLFFFKPNLATYAVNPGDVMDAMLLEDYRLDEDMNQLYPEAFFLDARYNTLPKLSAEARRPNGFPIYSLDYAMGPEDEISLQTLRDGSELGFEELLKDIKEAEDIAGFQHYFSDITVRYLNDFVRKYQTKGDDAPPKWSSTYNDGPTPPELATPPDPREGIQEVDADNGAVVVRWDGALDKSAIEYTLYYDTKPFQFDSFPDLANTTRVELTPERPQAYEAVGTTPKTYPYERRITALTPGTQYYFAIRAADSFGNKERNRSFLTATPFPVTPTAINIDGNFDDWTNVPVRITDPADVGNTAGPDWRRIWLTNDAQNLYVRFTSDTAFNVDGSPTYDFSRLRIYIDADQNADTGFFSLTDIGAIGSDLLVSGDALFEQDPDDNNTLITSLDMAPLTNATDVEFAIPLSEIKSQFPDVERLNLVFNNDEVNDLVPDDAVQGQFLQYTLID